MEVEISDGAERQLRAFSLLSGFRVEQVENARAIFIYYDGDRFTVGRKRHFIHVPRNVAGEHGFQFRDGIEANEALKLRTFVRERVKGFAVRRESGLGVGDFLMGFWRDQVFAAGFDVDHIEIAFVDGDVFHHEELRVIVRPILNGPAGRRDFHEQTIRIGPGGFHDADVGVLAIASRGGVRHPLAGPGKHRAGVARFSVGNQRDLGVVEVIAIELIEFAAAFVLREDDVFALFGLDAAAQDRLRQKGELLARAARHLDQVKLRHIGKARRDKHLASFRVPAIERRRAKLHVATGVGAELGRNLRHVIENEAVRHLRVRRDCAHQGENG